MIKNWGRLGHVTKEWLCSELERTTKRELARDLGVQVNTITYWCKKLGVTSRDYRPMRPFKEARSFVRGLNFKGDKSWSAYCKSGLKPRDIPASPRVVYQNQWISFEDWFGTPKFRKSVNHKFFSKWSNDMAYVFGLWFADGNLCNHTFSVTLHNNDSNLICEIAKKMESTHKIQKKKNNATTLAIWSKQIEQDLIAIGGRPKKSRTMGLPPVPSQFFPDFVRGFFDGDGCISFDGRTYRMLFCCASRFFIEELLTQLRLKIPGLGGSIRACQQQIGHINGKPVVPTGPMYEIRFAKYDSLLLGEYIYKTSSTLRMDRKYQKYLLAKTQTRGTQPQIEGCGHRGNYRSASVSLQLMRGN